MDRYSFRCRTYIEYEGDIWFPTTQFNGLISVDKENGKIKDIYFSDEGRVDSKYMYSSVILYEDKLYLIPNFCTSIAVFDLSSKKMKHIKISKDILSYRTSCSMGGFIYGEFLYILPAQMQSIIKMNIKTYELKYITDVLKPIYKTNDDYYFRGDYEILGEKMYAPLVSANGVAVLDLKNDNLEIKAEHIITHSSTINKVGDKLYLGGWEKPKVWVWNLNSNKIEEIQIHIPTKVEKVFNGGVSDSKFIALFPYSGNELVVINSNDMSYQLFELPKSQEEKITTYCIEKSSGIIKLSGDNDLFKISDLSRGQLTKYVSMDDEYNKGVIENYFLNNDYFKLCREQANDLELFLSVLAKK